MILPILNIIRKLVNKYVQVSIQVWTLFDGFIDSVINGCSSNPMSNMNLFENAMAMRNESKYE